MSAATPSPVELAEALRKVSEHLDAHATGQPSEDTPTLTALGQMVWDLASDVDALQ